MAPSDASDLAATLVAALRVLGGDVAWIDDPSSTFGPIRFEGGTLVRGTGRDDWVLDSGAAISVGTPAGPVPDNATVRLGDGRTVHFVGVGPWFEPQAMFTRRALPWADLAALFAAGWTLPALPSGTPGSSGMAGEVGDAGERRAALPSGCSLVARAVAGGWTLTVTGPTAAALLYHGADGRVVRVELTADGVTIGRAPDCVVRTDDPMVSRRHARVFAWADRFYVEDLGVGGGTWLNERRIACAALAHNDVVRCASLQLRFVDPAPQPMPTPLEVGRRCVYRAGGLLAGSIELDERVAVGAHSILWRTRADASGRSLAVKQLRPDLSDAAWHARFLAAGEAMTRLEHPAAVRVVGVGEGPRPLRVLEWLAGETLAARLARGGRLGATEALWVIEQLAGALAQAHQAGVIARLITPARVWFTGRGDGVKLAFSTLVEDRGVEATMARAGQVLGEPAWMSPEQARGQPTLEPTSDIYVLGLLLYAMLAGAPPFVSTSPIELVFAHLRTQPPSLREVPEVVAQVAYAALAKKPIHRPASAEALAAACAEARETIARWN